MFKIFGKRNPAEKEQSSANPKGQFAPGTSIQYDPGLVDHFIQDHRNLLDLFTSAAEAFDKQDHALLREHLKKFQDTLTGHLLTENVRFYTYMKYLLQSDAENSELLRAFQSEMSQIGKVVFAHLTKYTQPNSVYDQVFKKEFDDIGAALVRRIEAEESQLYTLYMPPAETTS